MSPAIVTDGMKEARKARTRLKELSKKKLHWYNSAPSKKAHNYMVDLCDAATERNAELEDYTQGLQEAVQELGEKIEDANAREEDTDKAFQTLDTLFNEQRLKLEKFEKDEIRSGNYKVFTKGKVLLLSLAASALIHAVAYAGYKIYSHYNPPQEISNISFINE